jgi:hypothetical protein
LPLNFLPRAAALAAAAAMLALPAGASAADSLGLGQATIPGSALKIGVSGAAGQDGKISARFANATTPLFHGAGPDVSGMNDDAAAVFALNTPSGLYSGFNNVYDGVPFTQTSAPAITGTGTAGDPYVVTSQFDATSYIHITQTVTHVSGTTKFVATWAIRNGGPSTTAMQAFAGGDTYVNNYDSGTGAKVGASPNRTISQVAPDGTAAQIVEQPSSPWSHFYTGDKTWFQQAVSDSTFGSFPDMVTSTSTDSAEAVEWDYNLGASATKTVSIAWNFTPPALPQVPSITGGPANGATTSSTAASPTFVAAAGDTANSQSFECALDGGSFTACTSPKALTGLAEGAHTFSVRAVNAAGFAGPQADRTWTVDTTPPATPSLTGAPTGTVAVDHASIALNGEGGATFKCSVDGGSYVTCTSPLSLSGLADGNHVVAVKQYDAANNVSAVPATASWTVDTSVPAAPSTTAEPVDTTATTAALEFTTPAGLTSECSLDGAAYQACTSPVAINGLAVGQHTLQLRMVSAAGTPGAARTITWEVQAPPVVVAPTTPTTNTDTTSSTTTTTTTTTPTTTEKATPPATTPKAEAPATTLVPNRCVSRRSVNIHWALPKGAKAKGFKVLVDGKVIKKVSATARAFKVSLAGRTAATVKVQVKAIGADLATTRVYRTCAAGKGGKAVVASVILKKQA